MSAERERWLLAIDTSTEQASLALTDGTRAAALSWPAGRDQTVSVLAEIDHLLETAHVDRADLRAIGVSTGPGMFTGVRVGMSVAKGLHLGLGVPLIGVSTLDATAYPYRGLGRRVIAVVTAGRGRVIWADPARDDPPVNGAFEELLEALAPDGGGAIVTGDLSPEQAARLAGVAGVIVPPILAGAGRASAIAAIAWERARRESYDDPTLLAPAYVHGRAPAGRG